MVPAKPFVYKFINGNIPPAPPCDEEKFNKYDCTVALLNLSFLNKALNI